MVKYYCCMCKKEYAKAKILTLQTKQGDGPVKTNHLCNDCSTALTELGKAYLTAPGQVGEVPKESAKGGRPKKEKAEPKVEVKEEPTPKKKEVVIPQKLKKAKKEKPVLNTDSFIDELPIKPRSGSVQQVQRALLCVYKGMTIADIERVTGIDYQNIFRWKKKYASKIIAERHTQTKRDDAIIVCVIEAFISGLSVEEISEKYPAYTPSDVKTCIAFYTGLDW